MGTNNILQFAPIDLGTNLLTQAAYLAASDRTNGNQPGVASARLNNKALKQASTMAAGLAQFIADNHPSLASVDDTMTPSQVSGALFVAIQGRLIKTTYATVAGSYVFTPDPATRFIDVEGCAAGGGGGGATATGAGQQAAGAGGAGGGYFRKIITSAFAGVTYTVGAPGIGGTGASAGTTGGTSSFGAIVGYSGGGGGSAGGAATIAGSNTFPTGTGTPPNVGIGTAEIFTAGGQGFSAWYGPSGSAAGAGGGSFLGPGAYGPISLINLNSNGFNSAAIGGGGGGALNGPSQGARKGGDGGRGIIIIREYS